MSGVEESVSVRWIPRPEEDGGSRVCLQAASLVQAGFQFQGIYGINYHVKDKITMADLGFRVNQVVKTEVDVTQAQLARNGVLCRHDVKGEMRYVND